MMNHLPPIRALNPGGAVHCDSQPVRQVFDVRVFDVRVFDVRVFDVRATGHGNSDAPP
jgi:hypothetical protein